jgi:hypothetical protein
MKQNFHSEVKGRFLNITANETRYPRAHNMSAAYRQFYRRRIRYFYSLIVRTGTIVAMSTIKTHVVSRSFPKPSHNLSWNTYLRLKRLSLDLARHRLLGLGYDPHRTVWLVLPIVNIP